MQGCCAKLLTALLRQTAMTDDVLGVRCTKCSAMDLQRMWRRSTQRFIEFTRTAQVPGSPLVSLSATLSVSLALWV